MWGAREVLSEMERLLKFSNPFTPLFNYYYAHINTTSAYFAHWTSRSKDFTKECRRQTCKLPISDLCILIEGGQRKGKCLIFHKSPGKIPEKTSNKCLHLHYLPKAIGKGIWGRRSPYCWRESYELRQEKRQHVAFGTRSLKSLWDIRKGKEKVFKKE